jgi:outer membrane protein, multidrug efflux system
VKHRLAASGVLALVPAFIAGCSLGPKYARPTVATPPVWKEEIATSPSTAPSSVAVALPSAWWKIFNDAELDALESQVVSANQDLQRAAARVAEARALARLSAADLSPQLAADSTTSRFRASANRAGAAGPAATDNDYSAQLGLSYELDFWGRVRSTASATRADAAAVADDFQVALVLLTTETAANYHQLRSLDAEKSIVEATLALRRDAVRLQETRSQAGLINEVDVTRARTEAASVEAELHAVARSRARAEHALAVLCGKPPGEFSIAPRATPVALPAIPAGLPASLLQRRPDLAAAEHRLQADCARIGVAKADFFPRLSLTGSAGFASADLSSLTQSDSAVWSFGPSVHLPVFDGGRNRANLRATEARYEESMATYRNAVLNAFREVEDALSDLDTLSRQGDAVDRALLSARDTAALATERYQRGLSSYLEVVDAQRSVLQAERSSVQLHGERTRSTLSLVKALGGGWEQRAAVARR